MRRSGLSLIELMTVIAVIGLLVGLLVPAVSSAREAARRVHCQNNIRQNSSGLHSFVSISKRFPPNSPTPWTIETLRIFNPSAIQQAITTSDPEQDIVWESTRIAYEPIDVFLCPTARVVSVDGRSISNYGLNHFLSGVKPGLLLDGTSQTILIGEIPSETASLWTWGPLADEMNINSSHASLVSIGMVDGSVHSISKSISRKVLERLLNPNDGLIVDFDWK